MSRHPYQKIMYFNDLIKDEAPNCALRRTAASGQAPCRRVEVVSTVA